MTAKKRTTAKNKAEASPGFSLEEDGYFPETLAGISYRPGSVKFEDGQETDVLAPILLGRHPDEHDSVARQFVTMLMLARKEIEVRLTPEVLESRLSYVSSQAARFVVDSLHQTLEDRFGAGRATEALGGVSLDQAARKHHAFILENLKRDSPGDLITRFEQGAVASLVVELHPLKGDQEAYTAGYEDRYFDHVIGALNNGARHIAQERLANLRPEEATFDELGHLLREGKKPVDAFTFGTSQIGRALQEGIIYPSLRPRDKRITSRQGDKRGGLKVRTELAFDGFRSPDVTFSNQDEVLMSIQKNLLSWKQKSAALLKLHLDLTNAAYEAGGDEPEFIYRLSDALDRQGYARHDQRRGHHNETMQGIRERLEALYSHRVTAWKVKNEETGETLFSKTPYWIVEEFLYVRQDPIPFKTTPNLARLEDGDPYIAVRIKPGNWWRYADMKDQRIPVPASILKLPTDGNGNERQRMALLLATYLAMHVRRNQKDHAGKSVRIRTGTLLEQSGYVTKRGFLDMKARDAARTREYLNDLNDGGALPLLRELRAFDVMIRDEADFFASGRGWKERFWAAMLEVSVPDLGLPKPGKTKKR